MRLTDHEKQVLEGIVKRIAGGCEHCHKDKKLIPHRIQRGHAGGKYIPRNIMMVCTDCHAQFHSRELMGRRG